MADEYRTVDVWIGTFLTQDELESYLEETFDEDDEDAPNSRFAADQGESFIDHDFMESSFHETPSHLTHLLANHSFAGSYSKVAITACEKSGVAMGNVVVLVFGAEIDSPRSVKDAAHSLTYLGRFDSDSVAE
ncbi:MAG: immunity 22 family protein [Gemmataceae bacterium]